MRHVYAILRSDDFLADLDIAKRVTVKKIVWAADRAEREVERLNKLNADKNCRYFWQLTRLEEEPDNLSSASQSQAEVMQVKDRVYIPTILDRLRELADKDYQRRVWLASSGPEISSLTEAVEGLYTDSALGSELDKPYIVFTEIVDAKLRTLERRLLAIDNNRHPSEVVEDPKMEEVRVLAREILEMLAGEGIF